MICDAAGDVTGVASEAGVAGIAAISGVAAAAGAAAVTASGTTGGLFMSGEEASPGGLGPEKESGLSKKTKGLFSNIAPLIRGDIKAKMVANIRDKDLVLDMAEIGQAGWK